MDNNIISKYMAHLKVNLLWAEYRMVHEGWYEKDRQLDVNKFYFFEDGEGLIIINGVRYNPKPGELLFIPYGCVQTLDTTSPKRYLKHWCHFDAFIGTSAISDILDVPLLRRVDDIPYVTSLFNQMRACSQSDDGFAPIKANSLLLELIHYYFTVLCKGQIGLNEKLTSTKLNALLSYMEDNLDKKLLVGDFAKVMNLHPNYLIRLFRNTFGTSPMEYFNRMKIDKAKELLEIDEHSINAIAYMLGFNTPHYFSTTFKKHTGYTPRDYRNLDRHQSSLHAFYDKQGREK